MNDLYIHQLETENKQLREALKTTRKVLEGQQDRIDKAIEYIKENCTNYYVEKPNYRGVELINIEELLEILGDKENE